MFDGLSPDTHTLGSMVQADFHGFQDCFMLPAGDTSLDAMGAFLLDGALLAI